MKNPSLSKSFCEPSTTTVAPSPAAPGHIGGDLVAVLARDQRAHLGVGVGAVSDDEAAEAAFDGGDERVADLADGDEHADGHATLAGRAVRGGDGGVCGRFDVCVFEHDHVVLRAAECLDALAVGARSLVDRLGDRGGSDEADGVDVGAVEDGVDGDLVTVHDVEHAGRQPGLEEQPGKEDRRGRVLLARLEHDGVAARDGAGDHPQRNHHREVERRDAADDSDGLLDAVHVDAC